MRSPFPLFKAGLHSNRATRLMLIRVIVWSEFARVVLLPFIHLHRRQYFPADSTRVNTITIVAHIFIMVAVIYIYYSMVAVEWVSCKNVQGELKFYSVASLTSLGLPFNFWCQQLINFSKSPAVIASDTFYIPMFTIWLRVSLSLQASLWQILSRVCLVPPREPQQFPAKYIWQSIYTLFQMFYACIICSLNWNVK